MFTRLKTLYNNALDRIIAYIDGPPESAPDCQCVDPDTGEDCFPEYGDLPDDAMIGFMKWLDGCDCPPVEDDETPYMEGPLTARPTTPASPLMQGPLYIRDFSWGAMLWGPDEHDAQMESTKDMETANDDEDAGVAEGQETGSGVESGVHDAGQNDSKYPDVEWGNGQDSAHQG